MFSVPKAGLSHRIHLPSSHLSSYPRLPPSPYSKPSVKLVPQLASGDSIP